MKKLLSVFLLIAASVSAFGQSTTCIVTFFNYSTSSLNLNNVWDWPYTPGGGSGGFQGRHNNFVSTITLAPGQTVSGSCLNVKATNSSFTYGGYLMTANWVAYQIGSVSMPSMQCPLDNNATQYLNIYLTGTNSATTNAPITYTNYTMTVKNVFQVTSYARWTFNGVWQKTDTLLPGGTSTYTSPSVRCSPPPADTCNIQCNQTTAIPTSGGLGQTNGGFIWIGPGDGYGTNYILTGLTNWNAYDTNTVAQGPLVAPTNLITFPTPSGAASESSLQAGIDVLHQDLTQIAAGQNAQNNTLISNVVASQTAGNNIYGAITNQPVVSGGTNGGVSSNVNVQNWPVSWSNNLSQIASNSAYLSNLTNLSGDTNLSRVEAFFTNLTARIAGTIPASSTNVSAATNAALAAEGDYGVNGVIDGIGSPTLPSGSPSAPDMSISFVGQTVDLDPVHMFPSVSTASLIGFRLVFLLAFFLDVGGMFWKLIQIKASTQTGGVPDLEVSAGAQAATVGGSIGGNFLGVIIALAVPVTFLALFSGLMYYFFSHLGYSIADAMKFTDFTDSLGSTGYYLLASFVPVNLLFSLVSTRLTLTFTLGKLVSLASSASRWLWGK